MHKQLVEVKPTVSVVIPCYNGAAFLRETLDSVLAQTYAPLEVIVVDDGSTDDSASIAESYGQPVRVIRQHNQGESIARNRGMDEARGEWLAVVDADDLWKPEKLERQIAFVNCNVVAVHTNVYLFGRDNRDQDFGSIADGERYTVESLATVGSVHSSSVMFRASLGVRYPTWTQHREDVIFAIELSRHGLIVLVRECLVGYRLHDRGQSAPLARMIDWHASMDDWVRRNSEWLTCEQAAFIREYWLTQLFLIFDLAKWKRKWCDYWKIRDYLNSLNGQQFSERRRALLSERIWPIWMYVSKDFVDSLVRRK